MEDNVFFLTRKKSPDILDSLTEIAAKITTNIINFLKLWFMLLILLNLRILQNNREILLNYLDKNT